MGESDFSFEAPDRMRMWRGLALTMSQAAAVTGASERQIQHWMDRGYLPGDRGSERKVNGDGLDAIVLIRQARAAGIPLRRAAELATEWLADDAARQLDAVGVRIAVDTVVGQLRALRDSVDASLASLSELQPARTRNLPASRQNRV